jgi:hypothetical protein
MVSLDIDTRIVKHGQTIVSDEDREVEGLGEE